MVCVRVVLCQFAGCCCCCAGIDVIVYSRFFLNFTNVNNATPVHAPPTRYICKILKY